MASQTKYKSHSELCGGLRGEFGVAMATDIGSYGVGLKYFVMMHLSQLGVNYWM